MKHLRIVVAVALVAVLAVALVGCGNKDVAATVNGEKISNEELQAQLAQVKKRFPQFFQGADAAQREIEFKQRLLDELINRVLIEQAAKDRGIKVTDEDVQNQIDTIKKGFKDQAAFEAALKNAGIDPTALNEQIRTQLVTQKLVETLAKQVKTPTDAEIKAYYDSHKSEFGQTAAKRASHILVKDKAAAEKLLTQLKAGADFEKLAKANSIDTVSAAKGGDLDWPTTPFVPEFQAALDKLKVGQTSAVVKTQFGYHIIKVTDERAAKVEPLSEVKTQIVQKITEQKKADLYQKLLDDLKNKAKIEIFVKDLATKVNTGSSTTTGTK
jgi:foldase protein PrsA